MYLMSFAQCKIIKWYIKWYYVYLFSSRCFFRIFFGILVIKRSRSSFDPLQYKQRYFDINDCINVNSSWRLGALAIEGSFCKISRVSEWGGLAGHCHWGVSNYVKVCAASWWALAAAAALSCRTWISPLHWGYAKFDGISKKSGISDTISCTNISS